MAKSIGKQQSSMAIVIFGFKPMPKSLLLWLTLLWGLPALNAQSQLSVADYNAVILGKAQAAFLRYQKEVAATLPHPTSIGAVPIGGEFTWPTYLAATVEVESCINISPTSGLYSETLTAAVLASSGAKANTFGQLNLARSLWHFCANRPASQSPWWQTLPDSTKQQWLAALDVRRSYDPATKQPTNGRPTNYLAVALLAEAYTVALGFDEAELYFNPLFAICVQKLEVNGAYLDDGKSVENRFDRYQYEFGRFLLDAAALAGNKAQLARALSLKQSQSKSWLAQYNYHYANASLYGRSHQNAWDDVFEEIALMAKYPSLRPVPIGQLGSLFAQAARYYLANEYDAATCLNKMRWPGKTTYSYAKEDRVWSYSVGTWAKMMVSWVPVHQALIKDGITTLDIAYRPKSGFAFTSFLPDGSAGIITYQNEKVQYSIPIVGAFGPEPSSDYQPIPYGMRSVQVPTAQDFAYMLPTLYSEGKAYTYNSKPYQIKVLADKSVTVYYKSLSTEGKINEVAPIFVLRIAQKANGLHYNGRLEELQNLKVDSANVRIPSLLTSFKSTMSGGGKAIFCAYENEEQGKSRNGQLTGFSMMRFEKVAKEKGLEYEVIFATE